MPSTLTSGSTLGPGQSLTSPNGSYTLTMFGNGNLVLKVTNTGATLWQTHTQGNSGAVCTMLTDGNLVVMTIPPPAWASNTAANSGAYLALLNDGNMVIYNAQGTEFIWATNTS